MRLAELKNLGPVSEERLHAVGIRTVEELETVGAAEAYRRVKQRYPRETTWIWLYALHGALRDALWTDFPADERARLQAEVEDA